VSVIGVGAGAVGEINLGVLMVRRARLFGSTLRARPLEGKAAAARLVENHVLPLFESGHLRVPIEAEFRLEDAAAAYAHFAAGGKFGKVVLVTG
jgi:NADPH2:quinone reductase